MATWSGVSFQVNKNILKLTAMMAIQLRINLKPLNYTS